MIFVFVHPFAAVPVTVYDEVETGTNGVPLVMPPVHVYEDAPVPLSVTEFPGHIVEDGETVIPTAGEEITVMVTALVFVHPLAPVPVTVYDWVEDVAKATPSITPPDQE